MSETTSYTIEIPDVHPSLNKWTRMHYIARNELKQQWGLMVDVLAKKAKLPQFKNPVEIFITYHHPRITVDLDNYTPKFIIDGLKSYLGDDNVTRLKRLGWEFVQCEDKSQKKSVVVIKELDEVHG